MITMEHKKMMLRAQNMSMTTVSGFVYASPLKAVIKNSTHKVIRTIYKDGVITESGVLKFGNKKEICQYFEGLISSSRCRADVSTTSGFPLLTKWGKSKFDVYIRGNNYSFEIKPL